jgi:hypothetical protein
MVNGEDLSLYREIALSQVPRILGLCDRNSKSETFGCFDRYYWHYRLLDLPNIRFQEASLLLAILYKNRFSENIYHKNEKIKRWAEAGVWFWAKSRNRDGSVNEVYPYERSFCATSFSTYAVTEAVLMLKIEPPDLEKTGDWLSRNDNIEVANQMAGAAMALYNTYLITEKEEYLSASLDKVERLLKKQTAEGFFLEYGGYDIGYMSLTLSCLANYYQKTKNENLKGPLKRAVIFLEENVREDGSFDIEGTSRRTQYIYPYGLRIMESDIIKKHIVGLNEKRVINPGWLDDRYVISLTIDYLQAYLKK